MTDRPDRTEEIDNHLAATEIMLWDEDPDDEPGRTGEGWYFRFAGEDSWSGAYESEGEASDEARSVIEEVYDNYDDTAERYGQAPEDGMQRFLVEFSADSASFPYNRIPSWKLGDGRYLALLDIKDATRINDVMWRHFVPFKETGSVATTATIQTVMAERGLPLPDLYPYCDKAPADPTPAL